MNNKKVIERLRIIIKGNVGKYQMQIDISDAINALQDAEAEINRLKADAKKQAAIHLAEESKLLEEIARLKSKQVDPEDINNRTIKYRKMTKEEIIKYIEFRASGINQAINYNYEEFYKEMLEMCKQEKQANSEHETAADF